MNTGWATSRDGGRTWRNGTLPTLTVSSQPTGRWQRASDPVVAYDAAHGAWLIASLAVSTGQAAAIVVSRSPDGITWSAPVTVIEAPWQPNLLLDKEWIVCDNGTASPHRGSCYVTYSDFRTLRLEFQASRDGGLTWEPQVSAPDNAGRGSIVGRWAPAPQPVVRPNGDLDRAVLRREPRRFRPVGGRRALVPGTGHRVTDRLQGDAGPPQPSAAQRRGRPGRQRVRHLAGLHANAVVLRERPGGLGSADGVTWSRATRSQRGRAAHAPITSSPGSARTRAGSARSPSCTTSRAAGSSTSASPRRRTAVAAGVRRGA